MARAYVYLALRDGRPSGAGETREDARRLCEAKMAQMHEESRWTVWLDFDATEQASHEPRGELLAGCGPYAIRRVPVARFGEGG